MMMPHKHSNPSAMKTIARFALIPALAALLLSGCAAARHTTYIDPQFDFGSIERVAILPFENLSSDQGSAKYITRLFFTELLAQKVFDVVEPGEVSAFIGSHSGMTDKNAELSIEQIKDMAKTLNVQAIIFGSVGESSELRSGNLNTHVVGIDARMVNAETGSTVWSSSVNTSGPGAFARLFGVGERTRSNAARNAVQKLISSLVR
jgi:TolB-like protein